MKEYKIEITINEEGEIVAETQGMQGKICADKLDKILQGIPGERKIKNTGDYYKTGQTKQTIRKN